MHCSNLAADALLAAVNDYRAKQGLQPIGEPMGEHGHGEETEEEEQEPERPPCTLRVADKCKAKGA
jgi:hypothetical protein